MNIPSFTGETSLYKTRRHYGTARHMISSSMNSPIYLAAMRQDRVGDVDCGNCVGGECAALGCFESWVEGGGGPGGPYQGPGMGGGWTGAGGGGEGGEDSSPLHPLPPPVGPPMGQDKNGQRCYRQESDGSKSYGSCETTCKDLVIIRKDVEANRWVCKSPPPPEPSDDDDVAVRLFKSRWSQTG